MALKDWEERKRTASMYEWKTQNDVASVSIVNTVNAMSDDKPKFAIKQSSDGSNNGITKSQVNRLINKLREAQKVVDRLNN